MTGASHPNHHHFINILQWSTSLIYLISVEFVDVVLSEAVYQKLELKSFVSSAHVRRELLCLPTPLILVCGGSPLIPHLVHQPVYLSIWPAGSVHRSMGDSVVCMWVQLKRWCVSCVWVLQRGNSGDGCDLASTLCKYDLRKGYLFVLSWARVRRVRRVSVYCLFWLDA